MHEINGNSSPAVSLPRMPIMMTLAAILITLIVISCASAPSNDHVVGKPERAYAMADVSNAKDAKLPSFITTANLRGGYQYALAHPDQLQYIPCYCGCGLTAGHKDNLECYIGGVDAAGSVVFDNHASFCAICLEITQDVERLTAQGKSLRDIRTYVDQTHGEKGPGTETPLPPL